MTTEPFSLIGEDTTALQAWLSAGGDVNAVQASSRSTLAHVTAAAGHDKALALLVSHGVDLTSFDVHGFSPLMVAVAAGHVDCVSRLLEAGADPNMRSPDGTTALTVALNTEPMHWGIAKVLLQFRASPIVTGHANHTILQLAVAHDHRDVAKLALDLGAAAFPPKDHVIRPMFHESISRGWHDVVQQLLTSGVPPNLEEPWNGEPTYALTLALESGDVAMVCLLLDHNADPNVFVSQYESSLAHYVFSSDDVDPSMRVAFASKMDGSLSPGEGQEPFLFAAVRAQDEDLVAAFCGSPFNAKATSPTTGDSLLLTAARVRNWPILATLAQDVSLRRAADVQALLEAVGDDAEGRRIILARTSARLQRRHHYDGTPSTTPTITPVKARPLVAAPATPGDQESNSDTNVTPMRLRSALEAAAAVAVADDDGDDGDANDADASADDFVAGRPPSGPSHDAPAHAKAADGGGPVKVLQSSDSGASGGGATMWVVGAAVLVAAGVGAYFWSQKKQARVSGGEPPVLLRREGVVWILTLNAGENRQNMVSIAAVNDALDRVLSESSEGEACALVTTSSTKYWCNGVDLKWLAAHPDRGPELQSALQRLVERILTFPMPTIACITGHAFGGGLMLALAHDWRIMRSDRGWLCLPAVDIGVRLSRGLLAVMRCKVGAQAFRTLMLGAQRYGGEEAKSMGIVDDVVPESSLLATAVAAATDLSPKGRSRNAYGGTKENMYAEVVQLLQHTTSDFPQTRTAVKAKSKL